MLPPGLHDASLEEVESRFGWDARRRALYEGFRRGCEALRAAGCRLVCLDGSFVTEKPEPNDFDACWDPKGVDLSVLDPVLKDFSNMRRSQKLKYGGEFFPAFALADGTRTFIEFFQMDRSTGSEKGLIMVRL